MNDQASNDTHEQKPTTTARPDIDHPGGRHIGPITIGRAIAVTAAASLVVGLILGPIISGHPTLGADPSGSPEHTVTVSSNGVVSVAPDVADVVIGVMAQKPTVAGAQSAAATSMTSVIAAIKKTGVDPKDIVTVNISLNPVYDYGTNGANPRLDGLSVRQHDPSDRPRHHQGGRGGGRLDGGGRNDRERHHVPRR